jgi:hypothetical protein
MPGRGSETRRMASQVLVRLPAHVAAAVDAQAAAAGLTSAAWLRGLVVSSIGADQAEAVPVRRRRSPRQAPSALVQEVTRLREVVAELTGALVLAAGRTRERAMADLHDRVEAALPDAVRVVREIDRLKRALLDDERDGDPS